MSILHDPSPRLVKTANSGLNFDETVFGNTAEGLEPDEIASSIGITDTFTTYAN